jgi:hypothetical protein
VMRRSLERGNSHVEAVADLEILDQVLAQIEVDPQVVEIDQASPADAGRDVFARAQRCACKPAKTRLRRSTHLIR